MPAERTWHGLGPSAVVLEDGDEDSNDACFMPIAAVVGGCYIRQADSLIVMSPAVAKQLALVLSPIASAEPAEADA